MGARIAADYPPTQLETGSCTAERALATDSDIGAGQLEQRIQSGCRRRGVITRPPAAPRETAERLAPVGGEGVAPAALDAGGETRRWVHFAPFPPANAGDGGLSTYTVRFTPHSRSPGGRDELYTRVGIGEGRSGIRVRNPCPEPLDPVPDPPGPPPGIGLLRRC